MYAVSSNARQVFEQGILENEQIKRYLPPDSWELSRRITFNGDTEPSIPINWRFAESAAALTALEATLIASLMKRKCNIHFKGATINTDHAQLFLMSCYLWEINPDSKNSISRKRNLNSLDDLIPNYNFFGRDSTLYRNMVTNIYRTSDDSYFNLHGGLNPNVSLDMLALPHDVCVSSTEEAVAPFIDRMASFPSEEIQHLASNVFKQSGIICESVESFRKTEHAKANAHVSLFEIHDYPSNQQGPTWWSDTSSNKGEMKLLAGLKVVDLSRIIAAPTISRGLAELGASIMRVTSPQIPDMHVLHIDMNWGKWNCSLDLKTEAGKKGLRELI